MEASVIGIIIRFFFPAEGSITSVQICFSDYLESFRGWDFITDIQAFNVVNKYCIFIYSARNYFKGLLLVCDFIK